MTRRALLAALASLGAAVPAAHAQPADDNAGYSQVPSGVPPVADTLLPRVGLTPDQPGGIDRLRNWLSGTTAVAPATPGPPWTLTTSMTVEEEWTDNPGQAFGSGGGGPVRGDDFITHLKPNLLLTGDTERLNVSLRYSPDGQIFARNESFNQFRQDASGTALATIVPGLLFLDLRGDISQSAVFGGLPQNVTTLSPQNRQTNSSIAATPYLQRDFGEYGNLQIGAGYVYSAVDAPGYLNQRGAGANPYSFNNIYGSSWVATTREFGSFTTGEALPRLRNRIGVDATQYDGTGALKDASRTVVSDQASYAVNRLVSLLGEIGWEDVDYPRSGYRYNGGLYSVGVQLTPNADSRISAQYRYADGVGAPLLQGNWLIGKRLRVTGNYSEGISTYGQDLQNDLLSGSNDDYGGRSTGLVAAPLLNAASSNGGNQLLRRSRRWSISAVYALERDTFTAGFNYDRSTVVGNPLGLPADVLRRFNLQGLPAGLLARLLLSLSDAELAIIGVTRTQVLFSTQLTTGAARTETANVSWHHALTEDMGLTATVTYTATTNALTISNVGDSVGIGIDFDRRFGPTLSGHIGYAGNFRLTNQQQSAFGYGYRDTNAVTLGVTKTF